jgi:creatinine amidohydrolase
MSPPAWLCANNDAGVCDVGVLTHSRGSIHYWRSRIAAGTSILQETRWPNGIRHMTWPEIAAGARHRRVVVIPVGAIEQHGPRLPIDPDNLAVETVCEQAARRAPHLLVLAPSVHYGYNEHNMDFPGTVTVEPLTFAVDCRDVADSFGRMGFQRVLFVNGHGSNAHLLKLAARQATLRERAWVVSLSWRDLAREAFGKVRQSVFPGGVSHACELETSLYLHVSPERVRKTLIGRGVRTQGGSSSRTSWADLRSGSRTGEAR